MNFVKMKKTFHKTTVKYSIILNKSKTVLCTTLLSVLGYTVSNHQISPDINRLKPLLEMPPPLTLKAQKRIVGMFSYYSKFIQNFSEKNHILNGNVTFPISKGSCEAVLPNALYSIRSLLCTSTNETPHEQIFNFSRESTMG